MPNQRSIHRALVVAKWICVIIALAPGWRYRKTANGAIQGAQLGMDWQPQWTRWIQFQPWIRYESQTIETTSPQPDGSTTSKVDRRNRLSFSPFSQSLLFGLIGAVAFHLAARRHRPGPADVEPAETPSPTIDSTHSAG